MADNNNRNAGARKYKNKYHLVLGDPTESVESSPGAPQATTTCLPFHRPSLHSSPSRETYEGVHVECGGGGCDAIVQVETCPQFFLARPRVTIKMELSAHMVRSLITLYFDKANKGVPADGRAVPLRSYFKLKKGNSKCTFSVVCFSAVPPNYPSGLMKHLWAINYGTN